MTSTRLVGPAAIAEKGPRRQHGRGSRSMPTKDARRGSEPSAAGGRDVGVGVGVGEGVGLRVGAGVGGGVAWATTVASTAASTVAWMSGLGAGSGPAQAPMSKATRATTTGRCSHVRMVRSVAEQRSQCSACKGKPHRAGQPTVEPSQAKRPKCETLGRLEWLQLVRGGHGWPGSSETVISFS